MTTVNPSLLRSGVLRKVQGRKPTLKIYCTGVINWKSFLYYMDYDTIDKQTRSLYRQGISAFGGIAPTYRIALENEFCSQRCKNQFNVYKSREKKKGNKRDD